MSEILLHGLVLLVLKELTLVLQLHEVGHYREYSDHQCELRGNDSNIEFKTEDKIQAPGSERNEDCDRCDQPVLVEDHDRDNQDDHLPVYYYYLIVRNPREVEYMEAMTKNYNRGMECIENRLVQLK